MSIPSPRRKTGFSLIELLTATAILSMLSLMIVQIIAMSGGILSETKSRLDAVGQARLVLDRFGMDWDARISRKDLKTLFTKANGNDSFSFYSGVNGYDGTRRISLVGYRIQETTAGRIFQLERGAGGTDWTGANLVRFSPNPPPTLSNSDYEVLADAVFRLEFCYLLNTGTLSNTAAADLSNVAAVVVAVAAIDDRNRQIATDSQLQQISNAFPDSPDGSDPISAWSNSITQLLSIGGVPPRAVQHIRLEQRYFYVY